MVVHRAPGVAQPVKPFDYLSVQVQKTISIGIVVEDIFSLVTARGDTIERVKKFDADRARHGTG